MQYLAPLPLARSLAHLEVDGLYPVDRVGSGGGGGGGRGRRAAEAARHQLEHHGQVLDGQVDHGGEAAVATRGLAPGLQARQLPVRPLQGLQQAGVAGRELSLEKKSRWKKNCKLQITC